MKQFIVLLMGLMFLLGTGLFALGNAADPGWLPVTGNQYNMIVYGNAFLNGASINSTGLVIAAFGPGGDCRARGDIKDYGASGNYYLTVAGDINGEQISFRIWDSNSGQIYNVSESVTFASDSLVEGKELNDAATAPTTAMQTTSTGLPATTTSEAVTTTTETASTSTTSASTTTTTLACNAGLCEAACVTCSDGRCHAPGFECREELSLDKVFPANVSIGVSQINLILKNTGNVDLKDIYADLSGDGIRTLSKIPLAALAAGEKDYTFTKINATKEGKIDLVVKLVVDRQLKSTLVSQLDVYQEKPAVSAQEASNVTALSGRIAELKVEYFGLEQEYQNKKVQGYQVELALDSLREVDDSIKQAKVSLLDGDLGETNKSISLAEDGLSNAGSLLQSAQKPEVTTKDKIKNNMVYIGSIAAALISMFTAYSLIKSHINKQKIQQLQQRIRAKDNRQEQKFEQHEEIIEKHEEKLEEQEKKLEETEKKLDKLEEKK